MFTICTVGCGWMSSPGHGPSLKKYSQDRPDVVRAGCCDIDEVISGRSLTDTDEMFEMSGFYGSNSIFFDLIREGKQIIDLDTAIDCVKLQDAVRENAAEWHR